MKTLTRGLLKIFFRIMFKVFYSLKIIGLENLKFNGPSILMPNHVSFLDALMLFPHLPKNVVFVINTEMGRKFRFILPVVNHVLIDPLNPYSLKKVFAEVKAGNPLVIFPEGRLTLTGNFMKVYSGIAMIAARTQSQIFPIIISGAERTIFTRISDKFKPKYFTPIRVDIFPAITLDTGSLQNFRKKKIGRAHV